VKHRKGFVSNSSSSSFIVIADTDQKVHFTDHTGQTLELGDRHGGESEFGWAHEQYYDLYSKINFAYLQTKSMGGEIGDQWLAMLEEVLLENSKASLIQWSWNTYTYSNGETSLQGYIDHQSAAREGENTELFNSKEALQNFLFDMNSYIETDNDNR